MQHKFWLKMVSFVAAKISTCQLFFPYISWDKNHPTFIFLWQSYSLRALRRLKIIFHFQIEAPLMLMCLEGDNGGEHAVDFLSLWVSFTCYAYFSVPVWCFQIASVKLAKWQHMVKIKGH